MEPVNCTSPEAKLRLAELAMQLTLAGVHSPNVWNQIFKNQALSKDTASTMQAFDLIYSHLLGRVGMEQDNTDAPAIGPPTP